MKEKLILIHILDDYYFSTDGTQYVLVKRVVRNKRKSEETYEDEETLGYFSTLSGLCKKLARNYLSDITQSEKIETIKDYLREYDLITSRIEDAVFI